MSTFPGSPRLVKGAIIGVDLTNPLASVVIFRYNPDTLTRTLAAQSAGGSSDSRSEPQRFKGPPGGKYQAGRRVGRHGSA